MDGDQVAPAGIEGHPGVLNKRSHLCWHWGKQRWWEVAKVDANIGLGMADVVASQVSVRDLKTHLSEWLGRVQSGEVVEVTSHRKPIARITAVKQADSKISSPMQKAIDGGLISWNGQKPVFPSPVKLRGQGKLVSEIVMEDRG